MKICMNEMYHVLKKWAIIHSLMLSSTSRAFPFIVAQFYDHFLDLAVT